jgi:dienelactone hydrolase
MNEARVARQPVEREELVGTLFYPTTSGPHPTVVVFGGWGGGIREGGAEALVLEGFAALALAYLGIDPLPRDLVEMPLEYFVEAFAWLKKPNPPSMRTESPSWATRRAANWRSCSARSTRKTSRRS